MGIISENLLYNLAAVIIAITTIIILYFKWAFNYWKKEGLDTLEPTILFGNIKKLIKQELTSGEQFVEFYNEFKAKGLKHGGIYLSARPCYVPIDIEIIKCILQKDFQHFMNHGVYINEEADPLSGHLFNLEDTKWRNMRVKLTPTFTSGKMKMMFQTMVDCTTGLTEILNEDSINGTPVDIKDILARFTTDVIGSCAFGLECNCLRDPDTPFRKYGKRVFENTAWEVFKTISQVFVPLSVLKFLKIKLTKPDVEEFFMKIVKDTVKYREENNVYRKDFMHLLLQLKNRGKVEDDEKIFGEKGNIAPALTMNEFAAQVLVFFLAGFETSSTTMTFALFELATNQDIQEKARQEINTALKRHDGNLTYDACMEMTYLEKVIHETLRKYPPVTSLVRKCNKEYFVPDSSVCIKKGITVIISTLGIHYDPEYYPEPEKFDPERFSEENKKGRPTLSWLPFGEGPRICIGLRFGLLQAKVGLATILKNYNVTVNRKTKVPLEMEKTSFITTTKGGVWLNFKKLRQ